MEFIVGQKYILPPVVTHKSRTQPIYDSVAYTVKTLVGIYTTKHLYDFAVTYTGQQIIISFTHEELESSNSNAYGTSHTIGFTCPSGH